jgi:lysozyme
MIPEGLKRQLIKHEGLRLRPYLCPAGKHTVGVGHNYDANPLPDIVQHQIDTFGSITPDMADALLEFDIIKAETDCIKLYLDFHKFTENRQWALIDFLFNVGLTTARSFYATNRAINKGEWSVAADQMKKSLWARQVGSRSDTITEMIKNG